MNLPLILRQNMDRCCLDAAKNIRSHGKPELGAGPAGDQRSQGEPAVNRDPDKRPGGLYLFDPAEELVTRAGFSR